MRKLSILSQIVIIFVSILLISCTMFAFLAATITRISAEEEVYSRLISYSTIISNYQPDEKYPIKNEDMHVEFVVIKRDITFESTGLSNMVNQQDLNEIIETYNNQEDIVCKDKIDIYKNEKIYFVVNYAGSGEYTIMVTNSNYVTIRTKTMSSRMMLLFAIISTFSILTIGLWGTTLVSRIKSLQDHIDSMPKDEYAKSYNEDGFDELSELSKSVELMREEIHKSETAKKEMLQNISHDFKTPIAVIKSYAEAQIDGMADEDSSKIIVNNAEILKHKVNMLLEYNSLEYLSKNKDFEEVNMSEVIKEVVQGYKFQTSLKITLDLDEEVTFLGYKENYYTVVDNIVDNAKRYAKEEIKIVLKKDRLRIYNDGEHISKDFIENAFKPYEKDSKGQFGLGLSIVRKTLDFFNMQIKAVNEEVGVSFIITTRK